MHLKLIVVQYRDFSKSVNDYEKSLFLFDIYSFAIERINSNKKFFLK